MISDPSLTVADLFSGCGGFSLGFDYAGHKIVYALDNWDIACRSYKLNFPKANVECVDALTIDPSEIPDVDVIIGGPPCQAFSVANVGHKITEEDLDLINWFLMVVEAKKPKFWIMENVPGVKKHLPSNIMKNTYRMCDFGIPQIRKRVFSGYYNEPQRNPIEPRFPAIMATEYKSSPGNRQHSKLSTTFRRIGLVPECLMIQTFPLDYLLCGTLRDRYTQVGNAVPPIMAYRLGEALITPMQRRLTHE